MKIKKPAPVFVIEVSTCKPLMEEWAEGQRMFCAGECTGNTYHIKHKCK